MKTDRDKPVWVREARLPTEEELAWLGTAEGRAMCAEIAGDVGAETPSGVARWRRRAPAWQVAAAWAQAALRRAARVKFSRADEMLFDRVGLEQATDEVVARHKARRFAGLGAVADLCCGLGGDALALAEGRELAVMDWSAPRIRMAAHNVAVYGGQVVASVGDVTFGRPAAEAAHIDPDRRVGGPRRHAPESASPGVDTLQRVVAQYAYVAVKLSPGTAFEELPFSAEIELISRDGECKQAVAWTGRFRQSLRRATVLPSGESLSADSEASLVWPTAEPPRKGLFLYEPDAAVIRAGLVGVLAGRFGLAPIDEHIALLLGEASVNTAMLRPYRMLSIAPWSLKTARAWLGEHDIGRLDIKTRGFAARPEDILRRLRLSGERAGVLFLTRIGDRPTAILTERIRLDSNGPQAL